MSDRVRPKPQTKEEIEAELSELRTKEIAARATTMGVELMLELSPTHATMLAGQLLAGILGNSIVLEEASARMVFATIFARIEKDARNIMAKRQNLQDLIGGDHATGL